MPIRLKTVGGADAKVLTIDTDPAQTSVGVLKTLIEQKYSIEAGKQKVIVEGKVLADDAVLADPGNSPKPGGFYVLFVTKTKAAAAAAVPETPAAAAAMSPVQPAAPQIQRSTGSSEQSSAPNIRPMLPVPATGSLPSSNVEPNPESVALLMGMGFPEDRVRNALSAAFNNPDVAANFLFTEIPPPMDLAMDSVETSGVGGGVGFLPSGDLGGGPQPMMQESPSSLSPAGANPLGALRMHPEFPRIRQLVRNNPESLTEIMQELQSQAPALLQSISNNPQEFIQLLSEGDGDEEEAVEGAEDSRMHAENIDFAEVLGGGSSSQALSEADEEAIQRVSEVCMVAYPPNHRTKIRISLRSPSCRSWALCLAHHVTV
jgi:UV excision repair protein RAD23